MRNYGRIIALLLLILSMLLITACGGGSGTGDGGNGTPDGGSTDAGDGGGTGAGTGGENIGGDNAGDDSSSVKKHKVTVIYADGVIPLETNPIEVAEGEKLSFDVGLENGYLISEVEGAQYDPATRTVSIAAVILFTADLVITLKGMKGFPRKRVEKELTRQQKRLIKAFPTLKNNK